MLGPASVRPDEGLLSRAQARLLQGIAAKRMPALVIRTDVANVYGTKAPPLPFCDLQHPDIGMRMNMYMHACIHTRTNTHTLWREV